MHSRIANVALLALFYFNIPAGTLYESIQQWRKQSTHEDVWMAPSVDWFEVRTPAIQGQMSAAEALRRLLPAGLTYQSGKGWLVVMPIGNCHPELGAAAPTPPCWGAGLQP